MTLTSRQSLAMSMPEPEHGRFKYAVDWDGTCVAEEWPSHGDWLDGAVEALRGLLADGPVCIYSLRCSPYELDGVTPRPDGAAAWEQEQIRMKLWAAGLPGIVVWPNDRGKPPAQYYIDDRAVHYDGNWNRVMALIEAREAERRLANGRTTV